MFTVRKILVFCQASLFPASSVGKGHGVWSPEGLSWNSGCPSAPSPWAQLSKGQKSHCLTELLRESTRKDVKGMTPLADLNKSSKLAPCPPSQTQILPAHLPSGLLGRLRRRHQDLPPSPLDPALLGRGRTHFWGWGLQGGRSPKPCHTQLPTPFTAVIVLSHLDLALAALSSPFRDPGKA